MKRQEGGKKRGRTTFPCFWRNNRLISQELNMGYGLLTVLNIQYVDAFLKCVCRTNHIERKEGTAGQKCGSHGAQSWTLRNH